MISSSGGAYRIGHRADKSLDHVADMRERSAWQRRVRGRLEEFERLGFLELICYLARKDLAVLYREFLDGRTGLQIELGE